MPAARAMGLTRQGRAGLPRQATFSASGAGDSRQATATASPSGAMATADLPRGGRGAAGATASAGDHDPVRARNATIGARSNHDTAASPSSPMATPTPRAGPGPEIRTAGCHAVAGSRDAAHTAPSGPIQAATARPSGATARAGSVAPGALSARGAESATEPAGRSATCTMRSGEVDGKSRSAKSRIAVPARLTPIHRSSAMPAPGTVATAVAGPAGGTSASQGRRSRTQATAPEPSAASDTTGPWVRPSRRSSSSGGWNGPAGRARRATSTVLVRPSPPTAWSHVTATAPLRATATCGPGVSGPAGEESATGGCQGVAAAAPAGAAAAARSAAITTQRVIVAA